MQAGQGRGDQAGHVHLRHPYPPPDLALGQLLDEAQLQDPPLPLRQRLDQRSERQAVLHAAQLGIHAAEAAFEAPITPRGVLVAGLIK